MKTSKNSTNGIINEFIQFPQDVPRATFYTTQREDLAVQRTIEVHHRMHESCSKYEFPKEPGKPGH